jgi:hypothetical protein
VKQCLALLIFSLIPSCVTNPPQDTDCLTVEVVAEVIKQLEKLIIAMTKDETPAEVVSRSCRKEIYQRSGYEIIVYGTESPKGLETSGMIRRKEAPFNRQECFSRSLALLESLDDPIVERLMTRGKKYYNDDWLDPDIGAVRWMGKCPSHDLSITTGNAATLMHEFDHESTSEECVYQPHLDRDLCFSFSEKMPSARTARVPITSSAADLSAIMESFQDLYLGKDDSRNFFSILDELQAYAITSHIYLTTFHKFGRNYFYKSDSSRRYAVLPQMLFYAGFYLAKFEAKHPDLYKSQITDHETNRSNTCAVLTYASDTHKRWLRVIEKQDQRNDPFATVEQIWWKEYLSVEPRDLCKPFKGLKQ